MPCERLVKITEEREALEERVAKGEVAEGVYLKRTNALLDEDNGVLSDRAWAHMVPSRNPRS